MPLEKASTLHKPQTMSLQPSYKHLKPSENNNTKENLPNNIPPEATAAKEARDIAEIRGFFWAKDFAVAIGRHVQFVSDRCNSREIKTMRGGRPYRIPYTEYAAWMHPRT